MNISDVGYSESQRLRLENLCALHWSAPFLSWTKGQRKRTC